MHTSKCLHVLTHMFVSVYIVYIHYSLWIVGQHCRVYINGHCELIYSLRLT